ncbi:MAG: hypothetical protein ACHP8A_03365 [Terriglobales bacterium]
MSYLLTVATMSAVAGTGAQSASPSGNQNDYAPLAPEELANLVAPIALYMPWWHKFLAQPLFQTKYRMQNKGALSKFTEDYD